jgi:hypothetical protein
MVIGPTGVSPRERPSTLARLGIYAALACVVFSLAVFVLRGVAAFQAARSAPGVAVTSGCEEESWFALWRAIHGQPVYADTMRAPYASAYFNWLFYAAYARPLAIGVHLWGDWIIPLVGRLISAVGAIAGAGTLAVILRRIISGRGHTTVFAMVALVYFGPLVGWWPHTVRPDVWALTFETAGLGVMLLPWRRPALMAATACLFFYLAWACKQTYVSGLGAAALLLGFKRQWRPLLILVVGSTVLWALTFSLLGPPYRAAFWDTATTNVYYPSLGFRNLWGMFAKSFPLWLLVVAALVQCIFARTRDANLPSRSASDAIALGLLGLLVALPLTFLTGCKLGAASYYYFSTLVMLSLIATGNLAAGRAAWAAPAAFASGATLQLLILSGLAGEVSLRTQSRQLASTWSAWEQAAEPRYAHSTNLNVPWLNPGSPPFVLAYNYGLERAAGRTFEHGGIGGLIADGYFESLLLPKTTADAYDGGSLTLYQRRETVGDFVIYRRSQRTPN